MWFWLSSIYLYALLGNNQQRQVTHLVDNALFSCYGLYMRQIHIIPDSGKQQTDGNVVGNLDCERDVEVVPAPWYCLVPYWEWRTKIFLSFFNAIWKICEMWYDVMSGRAVPEGGSGGIFPHLLKIPFFEKVKTKHWDERSQLLILTAWKCIQEC